MVSPLKINENAQQSVQGDIMSTASKNFFFNKVEVAPREEYIPRREGLNFHK